MKTVFTYVIGLCVAVGISASFVGAQTVGAADALTPCNLDGSSSLCQDSGDTSDTFIENIINILLYIIAAAAVIVIIIAGIRYTVSAGNQQAVEGAKKMLMGGVIGLAVAIFAYTIAAWVINWLT